jgi:hypothetical protein
MNTINRKKVLATAVMLASAGWLASCGGGGSDSTAGTDTTTDSTGTSSTINGRITGFGSVIVNGVHFDVDAAQITNDGVPITESDLKVGMVIRLSGKVDADGVNGVATEIDFDEEVKGPVASVDAATGSFVVLGQTVIVDDETVFDSVSLDTLVAGNVVEISGYYDANGSLRASLVELKSLTLEEGDDIEVKGVIQSLDTVAKTFMLKTLVVDYSSAEFEDVPDNVLADGMSVEVKSLQVTAEGVLVAEKVEYEDKDHEEGEEVEVEGLVTSVVSTSDFTVNGYRVLVTDTTEFEEGTAANIVANVKIKVKGELNADGDLVADEIELKRRGNLRLESTVDAVNADSGVLTVLGIDVTTTAATVWKDDSEVEERYFNLSHISSGDRVEIRGYQGTDGGFIATAIEREDNDAEEEHSVKGPLVSFDSSSLSLTVLGVLASGTLETEYEVGGEVTAEFFFANIVEGNVLKVKGSLSSTGQLTATSVELEQDDGRDEFGGDRDEEGDDEASDDSADTSDETSTDGDTDDSVDGDTAS